MKTLTLPALAAVVLTALLSTAVHAQPARPGHAPKAPRSQQEILAELNLTDAQQAQLDAVMTEHRLAREALHDELEQQVESILTADQLELWQQSHRRAPPRPGHVEPQS